MFKTAILDTLDDGERVLRIDRPLAKIYLVGSLFGTFLLLFLTVAICILTFNFANSLPLRYLIPFVILNLLFLLAAIATPLLSMARKFLSLYVVTDRRAIVLQKGLSGIKQTDYGPKDLGAMSVSGAWFVGAGKGSLIFRSEEVFDWTSLIGSSKNSGGPYRSNYKIVNYGFLHIDNVKDVERLIREVLVDPAVLRRQKR